MNTLSISILTITIFLLSIIVYYISNDPLTETSRTYVYAIVLSFIIGAGIFYSQRADPNKPIRVSVFSTISGFFYLVAFITFIAIHASIIYRYSLNSFMIYLLLVFIAVIGYTLFYNILKNFSYPVHSNLFLQLLFYLPCLITDFITYLGNEYQNTPNIVFILFIIELLAILAYISIPRLISLYSKRNRIPILEDTAFLDKERVISTNNAFEIQPPTQTFYNYFYSSQGLGSTPIFNQNYCISFWLYMNVNSKTNVRVFDYGGGKPAITYTATQGNRDELIVHFTNTGDISYIAKVPSQKWNYFALNYNGNGICDLFINSVLEKSVNLGTTMPTYHVADVITIGADGGAYGAISNISYYKYPLSKSQLIHTYNLLQLRNPPTYPDRAS